MESVFITGATGYIGGSVAARFVEAGYRVKGLVRSHAAAERLGPLGIEPVIGTLDDSDLLSEEAHASDGVIDAASADHASSVSALLAGLKGSGKPYLRTSGSSVIGDEARGNRATDAVFTDDMPLIVPPMKQARRTLDLAALNAAADRVRSSVICPSLIYGVGLGLNKHSYQVPFLVANARQHGAVQLVGAGLNIWSNVHIVDLAELYLLAFRKAPAGSFYFAENGELSFSDLADAIAQRLGLQAIDHLEPEIAARLWGESKAFYTLGSNSRVRATRARAGLNWAPGQISLRDWVIREMPDDSPIPS
jgi:nucleoside-diphosphate-sugar epimerase